MSPEDSGLSLSLKKEREKIEKERNTLYYFTQKAAKNS